MKGLTVWVYRTFDRSGKVSDCTNGGISATHNTLTIIPCDGPTEPTPDAPAVTVVTRFIFGREYKHLVPCDENGKPLPGWWMFGGNYAKTSDSRFPNDYPLPIHDRQE